jgi:putative transposase
LRGGGFPGESERIGFADHETLGKENRHMKRTTKNAARKAQLAVVGHDDHNGLLAHFAQSPELFTPMLKLIASGKQTIESVMNQAGRAVVELLLQLSASSIAGDKSPGRQSGEVLWHGSQGGQICLLERRLKVSKPRLRTRGRSGREVAIPLYQQLQGDSGLAARMSEILVLGVSTRKYARVLPAMAASAGIAKSSVSRVMKGASEASLRRLMERSFHEHDILGVYIDGIEVAGHHVMAAVGLDDTGEKHLLGLVGGSSENAGVVKDLLQSLLKRGIDASVQRLFVIDGSKAIRSAIEQVYGEQGLVQRCRAHKVRNVTERLPEPARAQTKSVMHAAYKLPEKEGMARLRQQAKWLQAQYPDAAASLLEGLEETFTVNRLKLTPALMRCLCTTNIIENPNGAVRRVTGRICRWRDHQMVLRWMASAYLEAEKCFRRIQGYRDLWVLSAALGREQSTIKVDLNSEAA